MSSGVERGRNPAEQFRWFLGICQKGMDSNGTIAVFKDGEDQQLVRQAFVEIGDEYSDDICVKAQVLKKAAEAFLIETGVAGVEVVVRDIEAKATNVSEPTKYKQVLFKRVIESGGGGFFDKNEAKNV